MKKRIFSIILCISLVLTTLVVAGPAVNAADGDHTGTAGFTVNAYPNGVRMNMIPVPGAADYSVYMSTSGSLTAADVTGAFCLFSSGSYQPNAYFTNGDMDKIATTTAVTIDADTAYYFYYVTDGATISARYEARTQTVGTSWTSAGNYDISWYTSGSNPYTISTAAQLAGLAYLVNSGTNFSGQTVNLGISVDISAYPWTAIGKNLKSFNGIFDGQNNVVNSMYINASAEYQGLFGYTYGGTVKNLGVVNGFVKSGNNRVGGVIGYSDSSVQNCYNTGFVISSGHYVGGVVGQTNSGSVLNCYNTGSVTTSDYNVGGVVGAAGTTSIQNCYNSGSITITKTNGNNAGGVAGGASNVQNCYNTGSVTATGSNSCNIGGVTGYCTGSIQYCYNTGSVTATAVGTSSYRVGGVTGLGVSVQYCYNLGSVTISGSRSGGVAGELLSGSIKNSYAACTVTKSGTPTVTKIYYDTAGSSDTTNGTGTFSGADEAAAAADCLAKVASTNFCSAPTKYADSGVFSDSNQVNKGYPVLKVFGYTGDNTSIDSEFFNDGTIFSISNAYQMDLIRNYLDGANNTKIFQMTGNIDISPAQYNQTISGGADGADSWQPIGSDRQFYATFDGAGYSVSGLYINSTGDFRGLFYRVVQSGFGASGGVIKNVGVGGSITSSGNAAGGIAAQATFLQKCYYTGSVTSSEDGALVGGVAGAAGVNGSTMQDCYNAGSVTATGDNSQGVGGVTGMAVSGSTVQHCYNIGSVTDTGANNSFIGGVTGGSGATLQDCFNTGSVTVTGAGSSCVGGVLGFANETVQNCHNMGSVTESGTDSQYVGGVVGNANSSVQNCYNTGEVTNTGAGDSGIVGGVLGAAYSTVQNCYNAGSVSATGDNSVSVGGVAGYTNTTSTLTYCYNTGSITDTGVNSQSVGGVAGAAEGPVQSCYNTGSVTDTGAGSKAVGGIAGNAPSTIANCYNIGSVTDTGSGSLYVGGIAGYNPGTVSDCYYSGYNGGVGNGSDNTAADTAGQTAPFAKLAPASILTGDTATVTENNADVLKGASNIGPDFTVSFGAYSSSDTDVATVLGTTVTGATPGVIQITATITITQNDLNMISSTPAWTGTTGTYIATVSMPLTIIDSSPYTATVTVNKDDTAWTTDTPDIRLSKQDTSLTDEVTGSCTDGVYTFTGLAAGQTYYVWDTASDKYTGRSITNSSTSATVDYYTVTLTTGTGIVSTTGSGAYFRGSDVSIDATVASGYAWSKWTQTAGGAVVSTIRNYQITDIAAPIGYTANATHTEVPSTTSPMASFEPVTLTQTGDVAHNNVQYKTAAAVIGALPTQVEVTLINNSVVNVPVTWADTDHYNSGRAADYTFNATWGKIPAGANNDNDLAAPTVELTVAAGVPGTSPLKAFTPVTLTQTGDIAHNNVQYKTAAAVKAALPTQVAVTLVNNSVVNVPVTWADTDHYNSGVAAAYTFTATWGAMPAGADNDNGLAAPTVELTVAAGVLETSPLKAFTPVTLTQTGDIAHNNVQYKTAAAVKAALPTQVTVTLVNNSVVNVPVTWADTDHYNSGAAAAYTFTATWGAMPAGANNDNGLAAPTVEVTVAAGVPGTSPLKAFTPVTLTQTGDIAHNNVQYKTAAAVKAALPTQVTVTLVNNSVVNVPVTWADTDHYNSGAAAAYTFTATWGAMPAGANNDNGLAAPTVEVTVAAGVLETSPLKAFTPVTLTQTGDIAHNNVQYKTAAAVKAALPTQVTVTLVNNSVVNVPVTWADTDHYNSGAAAAYTFTATWGAMPAGANNDNGLAAPTVELTVVAGVPETSPLKAFTPVTLTQTGDIAHNNVQYKTVAAVKAALPTQVAVTLVNNSVVNVPVTWADTDHYNSGVAAAYTFTAMWGAMPAGANNDNGLAAPTVELTVAAGTQPPEPPEPSVPSAPSAPPASGVDIIVNGNRVNAGTASDSTENGRSVTMVTVDQQKLERKLAIEGNNALVIIPIDSDSDKLVGRLNGRMIKDMEDMQATLELRTNSAAYTLPASEIDIDAVSAQLGKNLTLSDIIVLIEIASPTDLTATAVKSAAGNGGFSVSVPAVDFNISCEYNGKTLGLSTFNTYVERTVAIPEGVDPAKITTGIVVNPDGTVRHVPTKVTRVDGRYHAVIKSLTNSTYAVIWHPVEFSDVSTNWAKASVNDMGSRMVIEGVGNNKYAPNRFITRAEFAAIVVRALGLPLGTGSSDYRDVGASKWYCGYIKTASAYGIIQGYNTTAFGPDDRITREQAMTMIARAMKITGLKPEMKDSEINSLLSRYSDGKAASDFSRISIAACLKTGIVTGRSSSAIAPKDYITRAEVAVMVQRLLQKSGLI